MTLRARKWAVSALVSALVCGATYGLVVRFTPVEPDMMRDLPALAFSFLNGAWFGLPFIGEEGRRP